MMFGYLEDESHFVVRRLAMSLGRAFAANDIPKQVHRQTLKALRNSCMLPSDLALLRQASHIDFVPGQPDPIAQATLAVNARLEVRQDLIASALLIAPLHLLPRLTNAHASGWPPSRLMQALDAAALS